MDIVIFDEWIVSISFGIWSQSLSWFWRLPQWMDAQQGKNTVIYMDGGLVTICAFKIKSRQADGLETIVFLLWSTR